jgi:hypothetical protein
MMSSPMKWGCTGRSARRCAGLASLFLLSANGVLGAQEAMRLPLGVRAHVPTATALWKPPRSLPLAPDSSTHSHRIAHGAQLGALAGVAVGLAYTLVLNTRKSCTEKMGIVCDEDAHDASTLLVPVYGGVAGALVGALIASRR